MHLDDLKVAWSEEVKVLENKPEITNAIDALEKETHKLDREIKIRDVGESVISFCLVPFWVYRMFSSNSAIELTGLIVLTLACLFIPYKLRKARQEPASKLTSVKAFLELEKKKVEAQLSLIGSVPLWYLGPLFLGIVLVSVGANFDTDGNFVSNEMLMPYLIIVTVFFGLIWGLNIRTVKKKFKPLLDKIEERLAEMDQN